MILAHIRQRLGTADVDRAKNDGPFARGVEHLLVKPLLALTLGQGGRNQKLEFGTQQANAVRARNIQSRHIVTKARPHHQFDLTTAPRDGSTTTHGRKAGHTLLPTDHYDSKAPSAPREWAN